MNLRQHQLGDLALGCGHTLPEAQLTYLQIGELNADRSNLILVPISYGARPDDLAWLAGPVLDPERSCIVIAGMFGNGASSSPSHSDNVAAQRQLLCEVFEVERIPLIYGWSMGAEQAYQWAVDHPEAVERICCVCGTARSASHSGPVPRRLTSHPIVVSCRPSRRPISARLCPSLCRSSICALCSSLRPSLNKRSRFLTHPEPFGHSR